MPVMADGHVACHAIVSGINVFTCDKDAILGLM